MAARILRAVVVIVKDCDEDGKKMEIATRRKREEDKVPASRWLEVSVLRLSFHTPRDRQDPPFKIIISLVKLH
jgi:hypothetical protein